MGTHHNVALQQLGRLYGNADPAGIFRANIALGEQEKRLHSSMMS